VIKYVPGMSDQNLSKQTLDEVKRILWKRLDKKKFKAFVYGSRARGTARKFSDVDIGIEGPTKIDSLTLVELESDFEESDLPYVVELTDFNEVDKDFYRIARSKTISLN
jgi:predicted nucleotidyltransferase